MKKILLICSVFLSGFSFGQIIAAQDSLTLGDSQLYYRADTTAPEYENVIGGNITWDYSGLTMEPVDLSSTNTIIAISASTYASDFPNAQYHEDFPTGIQSFFSNNGSSLEIEGFVFSNGGVDYRIVYDDDNLQLMNRPVSLNDMINDNIEGTAFAPFSGSVATADITGTAETVADGEGTLIIGGTTYANTIRLKTTETSSGNAFFSGAPVGMISVVRKNYAYYSTSTTNHFPLLMITNIAITIPGGATVEQKIVWSQVDTDNYLSIGDENSPELTLNVFPNPADDMLNIQTTKGTETIKLYNTVGKLIKIINAPKTTEALNVADLAAGVYFVSATIDGETKTDKLIIK